MILPKAKLYTLLLTCERFTNIQKSRSYENAAIKRRITITCTFCLGYPEYHSLLCKICVLRRIDSFWLKFFGLIPMTSTSFMKIFQKQKSFYSHQIGSQHKFNYLRISKVFSIKKILKCIESKWDTFISADSNVINSTKFQRVMNSFQRLNASNNLLLSSFLFE